MEKIHPRLEVTREQLEQFCRTWKITRLELFGSVLRDDFDEQSDVDVLATFDADARLSLFKLVQMEDDLRGLLGREVDLVERRSIEENPNWIRRNAILSSARLLYEAA